MDEEEEEGRRLVKPTTKSTAMVKPPTFRKVQVVYYISKHGGQLEHPHIVEVTHLAHHHLRLKDVLDRLSVLRGRGMPCLYSWSCKRMYKNGYVWNDLGQNDVICPSEGDEYVLKASQLVHDDPDKQVQVREALPTVPEPMRNVPQRRPTTPKRHTEFNEEDLEYQEKRISCANTPRCPRGVSTDEIDLLPRDSTTTKFNALSSSSPPPSLSTTSGESNNTSKRFEDGDPDPTLSRNSLLLHFMACGGSVGSRGKIDRQTPSTVTARKSSSSSSSLHKGVLCKVAAAKKAEAEGMEDEICCMSENPRFGNLQAEEREYFSGSIVEAMTEERVPVEPILNKSTSYKEDRSKAGISMAEKEMKREKAVTGKCIPRILSSKPTKI